MADYAQLTRSILTEATAAAKAYPLRNDLCRPIYLFHPRPTAKVCLFFHGFTAAPYQFAPLAQTLYRAGYNVLIPLMPNHGLAGEWGPLNPPPLPTDIKVYQDFARVWLKRCQGLGGQAVVGGLSGGATLAAWLGLEEPQGIQKTLLFAPYFNGSNPVLNLFTRLVNRYQEWVRPKGAPPAPGYPGFYVPALRVFLDLGQTMLTRSQSELGASMFVISSESDRAVSNMDHRLFFQQLLKRQPKTWYLCFDRVQDIPHTMMTRAEGNQYEFLLNCLAKGYIESDLSWDEICEIGYRMGRGQQCNAAIAQLKLQAKASPDLPTVMTMIDKREIALQRAGVKGH